MGGRERERRRVLRTLRTESRPRKENGSNEGGEGVIEGRGGGQ